MNLRTLRYFVAIADAGSFTAASARVSVAQPALTRQMRELEAQLGIQLLIRSKRGAQLTQHGVTLYESARRLLDEEARALQALKGTGTASAVITLGISPTFTRFLLPAVFQRCTRQIHGVTLRAREGLTPALAEAVECGSVDLAVLTNPAPSRLLSMQLLLVEPYALVSHPSTQAPSIMPATQLPAVPLLMTPIHRHIVEQLLAPFGIRLNVRSEIDSVAAIEELVLNDGWQTIMPVSVFNRGHSRRAKLTEISGVQLQRSVMLASRNGRLSDPSLTAIEGVVRSEMQRLTADGMFSLANSSGGKRRRPVV